MSTSTNSKNRSLDDEIDLIPLLQALWASKITIIATTVAGAVVAFAFYATSAEQWTASTYITKPSLYNLYKEVKKNEGAAAENPSSVETSLYNAIQNDVFFTAMGVMTAKSITLKESAPKTGNNESVLYIASATATTEEQARTQLKSALDSANTEALALNLPALSPETNVRAFNALDDIKIANIKNSKKYTLLGGFLGLILGSLFVLGRFCTLKYKHSHRAQEGL